MKHLAKCWKIYLHTFISLALFTYVVYNYGRLDDMSSREASVYGAALALAAVFILMPFSKLIKVGYIAIVPYLWHINGKAEQAIETANEAKQIAIEAKEIAERHNGRAMTDEEISEMVAEIFARTPKQR